MSFKYGPNRLTLRRFSLGALALVLGGTFSWSGVSAQTYPQKPIHMIVPFARFGFGEGRQNRASGKSGEGHRPHELVGGFSHQHLYLGACLHQQRGQRHHALNNVVVGGLGGGLVGDLGEIGQIQPDNGAALFGDGVEGPGDVLFDAFSRLRRIEARIAGPAGTQARSLPRNRRTLDLGR